MCLKLEKWVAVENHTNFCISVCCCLFLIEHVIDKQDFKTVIELVFFLNFLWKNLFVLMSKYRKCFKSAISMLLVIQL